VCVCWGGGGRVACAHIVVPTHAQDDFIIAVPTHGHIFYDPTKVFVCLLECVVCVVYVQPSMYVVCMRARVY
jgi:hypothetical protein